MWSLIVVTMSSQIRFELCDCTVVVMWSLNCDHFLWSQFVVTILLFFVVLLSRIPGDWTVGFRRGKKQSCSPQQGLRVGTSFGEFRQTLEDRGFSPTCFILCLRVILMCGDLLRPGWPWFRFQKIWTE